METAGFVWGENFKISEVKKKGKLGGKKIEIGERAKRKVSKGLHTIWKAAS